MQNTQPWRSLLIHKHKWFLPRIDGRILFKIYKQGPKASFHETKQCAKISGTLSILITKKLLIITKQLKTIFVFGIMWLKRKINIIYLVNYVKNSMIWLRNFTWKGMWLFHCTFKTSMLKVTKFANRHLHKLHMRHKMNMMTLNCKGMQMNIKIN